MKRVRLTSPRVYGSGQAFEAGDVIELPADEAAALVAAGQAEEVPHTAPGRPANRKG